MAQIRKEGKRVIGRRRKPARWSSITGGEKLPGALGLDPRGHGLTSREHREQEEKMANSPRAFLQSTVGLRLRAALRRWRRQEKEEKNLIYYTEGFPKLGAPLMVVLVCFAQGVGTYL